MNDENKQTTMAVEVRIEVYWPDSSAGNGSAGLYVGDKFLYWMTDIVPIVASDTDKLLGYKVGEAVYETRNAVLGRVDEMAFENIMRKMKP